MRLRRRFQETPHHLLKLSILRRIGYLVLWMFGHFGHTDYRNNRMTTQDSSTLDHKATELLIWRARAIDAYASVEQSLCLLFGNLLGSPQEFAAVVFYRLTNTHSRNIIIESLIEKRYDTKYQAYWHGIPNTPNRKGLMSLARQLDQRRNEIVHWHTVTHYQSDNNDIQFASVCLMKPDFWTHAFDSQKIETAELIDFVGKADFVSRSIYSFTTKALGAFRPSPDSTQTWLDIFQQPCTYPPSDNHPLSRKHKEP